MANLKVRLKRRNGTAFDDLFPEVAATSLLQSDGTALSTFSAEVLQQAHNSSDTTFVTGDADGGLNLRDAGDVLTDFGIAASTHTQAQSTINACYIVENGLNVYKANRWSGDDPFEPDDESRCETAACSDSQYTDQISCVANGGTWWAGGTWTNLSTALGYKADLDSNNKILFSQLPNGVDVKAMKFVGVTGNLGSDATTNAATLSSKFSQLDGLGTSALDQKLGDYLIATNDTTNKYIKENTSSTGDSYEFILAPSAADDDQPSSGSSVVIEAGDRIVFTNYTGSSSGSFTFFFAVINSAQSFAGSQQKGIVELSSTGQTLDDFDTGTTNRHERAVDEASLRDAMRDHRKVIEFTGNTSGRIRYWASGSSNLPTSLVQNGDYALVGTGTTKTIYEYLASFSQWGATSNTVTFPANASGIPSAAFDKKDIVYYDAGQADYLYLNGTNGNSNVLSLASNTSTSTILPADGDLVYYISP